MLLCLQAHAIPDDMERTSCNCTRVHHEQCIILHYIWNVNWITHTIAAYESVLRAYSSRYRLESTDCSKHARCILYYRIRRPSLRNRISPTSRALEREREIYKVKAGRFVSPNALMLFLKAQLLYRNQTSR